LLAHFSGGGLVYMGLASATSAERTWEPCPSTLVQ
jgi:hypothetical protein